MEHEVTYFHLQEVKELIEDKNKKVLGIALNPELETIVRITKIPKGNILKTAQLELKLK